MTDMNGSERVRGARPLPSPDFRGPRWRERACIKECRSGFAHEMARFAPAAAVAILIAAMPACSEREAERSLMMYEDGAGREIVRIVHSGDTVRVPAPVLRIGGNENEPPERTFHLVSDVAVLSDKRLVVVVDNRAQRVAVFDSTGDWLFDVGRQGRGPGEYALPLYADVVHDTLIVSDAESRRLIRYGSNGQFLGEATLPDVELIRPFATYLHDYIVEAEIGQLVDSAPASAALVKLADGGVLRDTLAGPYEIPEFGWRITDERTGEGVMVNPPAFEIYPPWQVSAGTLYFLRPTTATVEVADVATGAVQRMVQLPLDPKPTTDAERETYFRALEEDFELSPDALAAARSRTVFAAARPKVAGVAVDEEGRIWIGAHDPAGRAREYVGRSWLVVDLAREATHVVVFPEGFVLRQVSGQHAYGITTLENGVHVVDVMPLTR